LPAGMEDEDDEQYLSDLEHDIANLS
jgi:hypothetical protein